MTIERPMPPRGDFAAPKADLPSWRAGYDAARAAKLAGKPTPRAPQGVDGLSYASGAVEGAAAGERELDPRDVIADVLEELLIEDPRAIAEMVIERLRDAGFTIRPVNKGAPVTGRGV